MTAAPTAESTSAYLDLIEKLPPWGKLAAIVVPILVFTSWGRWSWVLGGATGMWAGTQFGADGVLLVGFVVGGIVYLLYCRFWDAYADCWWCKSKAKRYDGQGNFHFCFWCGGNGRRVRPGARVWAKYRDAT